jgi:hypothetical protein
MVTAKLLLNTRGANNSTKIDTPQITHRVML